MGKNLEACQTLEGEAQRYIGAAVFSFGAGEFSGIYGRVIGCNGRFVLVATRQGQLPFFDNQLMPLH